MSGVGATGRQAAGTEVAFWSTEVKSRKKRKNKDAEQLLNGLFSGRSGKNS